MTSEAARRRTRAFVMALLLGIPLALSCRRNSPPVTTPSPTVDLPSPATNTLDPEMAGVLHARRQAVSAAPEDAMSWGRLGQAFEAAEFPADARTCYTQAAKLDSDSAQWRHLLGLLQLQDDPATALSNLTQAAALSGSKTDAPRYRLGRALVELGRFHDATNELMTVLAANPQHAAARVELARVCLLHNQLKAAGDWLSPCFTNPYTARPSLLLLSQIKAREGQPESAAALAKQSAAMPKPFDWPDPFVREVQELRSGRARRAEAIQALLAQRRLVDAEAQIDRLLADSPGDPESLLLLGRLRLQQRRCEDAQATFERYLAASPGSLNGYVQLGLALACLSRWAGAEDAFAHAVALKPVFAQGWYNLGIAQARLGKFSEAIASWREAIRCAPGEPGPWVALAEESLRTGNLDEARSCLERLQQIDPVHPAVIALRASLPTAN